MCGWNWDAIIGVCGSLLGTILGWTLNSLSNNIGKINIYISDVRAKMTYADVSQKITAENASIDGYKVIGRRPKELYLTISLIVTNRKNICAGINSCRVLLETRDANGKKCTIYGSYSMTALSNLLNIPGKATQESECEVIINFLGINITKGSEYKVYLQYRVNGHRSQKKRLICKSIIT